MEKVNFKKLQDCIANIDYLFKDSYPVSFKVVNDKNEKCYECGISDDEEQYLARLYNGEITDVLDSDDPDMMSYEDISEMLTNKCDISKDSKLYLIKDNSFNGKKRCLN